MFDEICAELCHDGQRPPARPPPQRGPPACSTAVGITPADVAVLKNHRAKAVRFSTLDAICRPLGCRPGDVLRRVPDEGESDG
ncbi:helix-turn-helix domain-containing protein [Streptomyces sp. NPDC002755]|uniref:helix-turn-helix domain-containing protein n=1 Tax=Streptomyces sp. NPDC002884 TaxID=3154544 RepID=UPI00332B2F75